jgi:predicted nucleic acid-binding protein
MSAIFADSAYWIALLHRRDQWHRQALAVSRTLAPRTLVTTEWVLAEFLAFFSAAGEATRRRAAERTRGILRSPTVQVLAPDQALFQDGLALYERRPDKEYSLTDCISMQVMRRDGLTDVLTNDRHFTQEGFHILFHG